MSDGADSLNVAVAAGILLFEAARPRVYTETYSRAR
jgi:tRNA G18 (ribose-2'-O)-methylase SpoU